MRSRLRVATLACLLGCSDGASSPEPNPVATIAALTPLSQAGPPGTPANVRPAVRVTGHEAEPLAGIPVRFTVEGGAIAADRETDADGVARVQRWTLPPTPGVARLIVRVGDLPELRFEA